MRTPSTDYSKAPAGFTRSRAIPCPRVLAGLRCLMWPLGPCMCHRHARLLGHARVWRDSDGNRVIAAGPADTVDLQMLATFVQELAELGLEATVAPCRWNSSGLLLVVHAARYST